MGRGKQLFNNTIILSLGVFIPKLIALVTLPIVTKALSKDEYGTYDLVLTVASILIPVATLQIQQAAFRFLISAKENEKKAYINSTIIYLLFTIGSIVVLGAVGLIVVGVNYVLAFGICSLIFLESCYTILGQIMRGVGKTAKYSFSVVLYAIINLIFVFIFIICLKMTLIGVLFSMSLAYLFSCVYMIVQEEIRDYIGFRYFSKSTLKEMLAFSAPIVPSSISLWVVNLSDRLVIIAILGVGINGIYSVANKIPQLFFTAYNIFNTAWTESAVRAKSDDDYQRYYSSMFERLYDFLVGLMLVLIAFTPLLFHFLIDSKYDEAYYQMPILFLGVFFNSLVSFYGSIYIALKNTKSVAVTSVIGAIINLLINVFFIKIAGLYAASVSTVIAYLIITVFRAYDLNKVIHINYKPSKLIMGLSSIVFASILCYLRNPITFIVCAVFALLFNVFVNLKFFIEILNTIRRKKQ